MSATMARQGGRVQLEKSDMRLALNMAKMARGGFSRAAIGVSNGSSFGPGRFYRSAWQRPYPIKNRRFFKRTITLRPQILIREFSVWYVKYAA